jgi:hypothetical protein
MPQQSPLVGGPNDKYRKVLFIDTGFGFTKVNARVVEPYTPPTPQMSMKEIKIINGPSHFHQMGISSYKTTFSLLFNTKQDYDDYLLNCGWTHKYYDERGAIFLGSLETIKPTTYEGHRRYMVEVNLILIKKDKYDQEHSFQFQDIDGHWAQKDIEEMSDLGLVAVVTKDGSPVLYFRPSDNITRAEFVFFLNRTRRLIESVLRE